MYEALKQAAWEANMELPRRELVILTWGNVSVIDRRAGVFAIKPSGVCYDKLQPKDMVIVDLNGNRVEGYLNPSSDTLTHCCLYRQLSQIGSIVHTHSCWATTWAQACRSIPLYGTTHADYFSGDVPCTRMMQESETKQNYEWNTGKVILETLSNRKTEAADTKAVLVAGHGPFVWGENGADAVETAVVLEYVAKMAYVREQLDRPCSHTLPRHLVQRHFYRKHGDSAYYGQK